MLAAGLVAKKAVERGLKRQTVGQDVAGARLASSSANISQATGLQRYLDRARLHASPATAARRASALRTDRRRRSKNRSPTTTSSRARCLSGNRNFEARIHPAVRAAFLASPPLVVAFALAGRVDIDLASEPLGHDAAGESVYLKDIWPTQDELAHAMSAAVNPAHYRAVYEMDFAAANPLWKAIPQARRRDLPWTGESTYIKEPPFLDRAASDGIEPARISRRARACDPRQFDHHRSHQPDRQHQGELARRDCICRAWASRRSTSTTTARGA